MLTCQQYFDFAPFSRIKKQTNLLVFIVFKLLNYFSFFCSSTKVTILIKTEWFKKAIRLLFKISHTDPIKYMLTLHYIELQHRTVHIYVLVKT